MGTAVDELVGLAVAMYWQANQNRAPDDFTNIRDRVVDLASNGKELEAIKIAEDLVQNGQHEMIQRMQQFMKAQEAILQAKQAVIERLQSGQA